MNSFFKGLIIGLTLALVTTLIIVSIYQNPIDSNVKPLFVKIIFEGMTHNATVTSIESYGLDSIQFTLESSTYHSLTYISSNKTDSPFFQFYIKTAFANTGLSFDCPQSLADSFDSSAHFTIPNSYSKTYVITIYMGVNDGPYPSVSYHGNYKTSLEM